MLPEPATRTRKHDRSQPRRGACTVRVVSVRRNVRMCTPDLVETAATWATRPPSGVAHDPNVCAQCRNFERVVPPTLKLTPRYADGFKKCMGLQPQSTLRLNSSEAEFEVLLRSNNSSTKVISLDRDGPVRRETPRERTYPLFTESSYSTGHLFSLFRCAARGNYTSSV
jgi:hypothetical protein